MHAISHYHCQWIPGDERGFRARDHKIHSAGDYKNPPRADEHEGLRHWVNKKMMRPPVRLTVEQRAAVGMAFVDKLQRMKCDALIIACGPTHLHGLLKPSEEDVMRQIGKAKQFTSLKCPNHTGQLWGDGSDIEPILSDEQARRVFAYIDDHRRQGAWIWRCDVDGPKM